MSSKKPVVGLIFLIGVALITVGAGYYTIFLPVKSTCSGVGQKYTVNVTIHQWYFEFNGTDVTKNGWSICHGSTVTFIIRGTWEHDKDIGMSFHTHGFLIRNGVMTQGVTVSDTNVTTTSPIVFNVPPGDVTLICTVDCGFLAGVGGHPITTTIHVL